MNATDLINLANDQELIEIGRQAIEDRLIEMRDSRLSAPYRGNGLVVRESDGISSHIIRMGPDDALRIGLIAMSRHIENANDSCKPI